MRGCGLRGASAGTAGCRTSVRERGSGASREEAGLGAYSAVDHACVKGTPSRHMLGDRVPPPDGHAPLCDEYCGGAAGDEPSCFGAWGGGCRRAEWKRGRGGLWGGGLRRCPAAGPPRSEDVLEEVGVTDSVFAKREGRRGARRATRDGTTTRGRAGGRRNARRPTAAVPATPRTSVAPDWPQGAATRRRRALTRACHRPRRRASGARRWPP